MADSRGGANSEQLHTCPRCGYDQQGEIARWAVAEPAACPMVGRCSECGLELEWRLVMRPELQVPLWFIETAEVGSARWKVVGTTWRSILPWMFWRKVRMEYPFFLRRAFAVSLMICIGCYLLMMAVSLLTVSWNMGIGSSRWATMLESVTLGRFWLPFAADRDWIFYTPYGTSAWSGSWAIQSIDDLISAADVVALLAAILMPLTFRLLPITLRRCKVRRKHLVRIALYSAPWVLLWAGPLMRVIGWALLRINWLPGVRGTGLDLYWLAGIFDDRTAVMVIPVCALWLLLAWGFACSRYLRLPRAWAVAGALVIISTLISTLLVLLMYPMAYKHLFSGLV